MNSKFLEKLIISLLNSGSINAVTANKLLTELGSKYPSYTPDMHSVYAYLGDRAATAATICKYVGVSEASLSTMVKQGFLVKNQDNSFSVA